MRPTHIAFFNFSKKNKANAAPSKHLDKKLVHSLNTKKIPSPRQLRYLPKVLEQHEKRNILISVIVIIVALAFIGSRFYYTNFLPTPIAGGEYTEGLFGAPQFINPLLAQTNDVDTDLSRLLFSGLVQYDKNLQIIPDLAERWQIDGDGTIYTFTLRNDALWHDGQAVTADDVIFTVKSIQDPEFKSPLAASMRGISVEKIDATTIRFTLPPEPYPNFLEAVTFGILPQHIWGDIPPINANLTEYNIKPIGSGAWQFKTLTKDRLGNIKSYTLAPFPEYYGKQPYLEKLTFRFYPQDFPSGVEALNRNAIEGLSFLPKEFKKDVSTLKNIKLYSFSLPQYTAVFFNQKQNEDLAERSVRQALALAIDKPQILTEALQLEGEIIDSPLLPVEVTSQATQTEFNIEQANELLDEADWQRYTPEEYRQLLIEQLEAEVAAQAAEDEAEAETEDSDQSNTSEAASDTTSQATTTPTTEEVSNPIAQLQQQDFNTQPFYRVKDDVTLSVELTTVDQPENIKSAELLQKFWRAIGVDVSITIVESGRIARDVIKPRSYQALLFGIIVGSDPDPYPFWHSSQIEDPGLNLSLYANRKVDELLEDARIATDASEVQDAYRQFQDTLIEDVPAIFLYNPTYTYAADQKIKGIDVSRIIVPADRFNNIEEWYIRTRRSYQPNK